MYLRSCAGRFLYLDVERILFLNCTVKISAGLASSWFALAWIMLFCGCIASDSERAENSVLRLATTTSVRDSGLLDRLLPPFETANNCRIDVVAVGSGAALKLGERGDADVLIVHAPDAEAAFMKSGFGTRRLEFMHNFFVLMGPPADPTGVQKLSIADAFRRIANTESKFVSRGDNSGTHMREKSLWQQAGGLQPWRDYIESGQGMGATLIMADNLQGYVLSDEGTSLKFHDRIELVPMSKHEPQLLNRYSVIVVSPPADSADYSRRRLADKLADYLVSEPVNKIIGSHQIAGRQLFVPASPADNAPSDGLEKTDVAN